jgi:hypothetical protein
MLKLNKIALCSISVAVLALSTTPLYAMGGMGTGTAGTGTGMAGHGAHNGASQVLSPELF